MAKPDIKPHAYSIISAKIDNKEVTESNSIALIEDVYLTLIVITSNIPKEGFEFDPNINHPYKLEITCANKTRTFNTFLSEKKINKKMETQSAFQTLTFKVKDEVKCQTS